MNNSVKKGVRNLFLDDNILDQMVGLKVLVNKPKNHLDNPIIYPDNRWEDRCQVYGTALFDHERKIFRLWYLTTPRDRGMNPIKLKDYERAPHTTLCAYAESQDGIHWYKPDLGQFPYDGDTHNNLVDIGKWNCEGISVLYDHHDIDENRRWKAVYWDHGSGGYTLRNGRPYCEEGPKDGFCVAFSPDGISWKAFSGNPVISRYCDTNQNVVYDKKLGKYVAFSRFGFGRRLARSESDDFTNWTEPKLVLECDDADGPGTQIYGAGVDIYEGLYIAMVWIYREGTDGKIDTQLAVSRDGINWSRVGDRTTWLALGDDDSWEGGMIRSCERIIIRDDKLYIYYCGVYGPHTGPKFADVTRKHRTAIGLVTARRDGFVSLDAKDEEGYFLSKPFIFPGGDLYINVDASKGHVKAEIIDSNEKAIPGCNSSHPITGDHLSAKIQCINADLAGNLIRLRLNTRNAKVYSWWFE